MKPGLKCAFKPLNKEKISWQGQAKITRYLPSMQLWLGLCDSKTKEDNHQGSKSVGEIKH